MKKRWIALWLVVFLGATGALASMMAAGPSDGLFVDVFDNY